jgi:hypothetical protein
LGWNLLSFQRMNDIENRDWVDLFFFTIANDCFSFFFLTLLLVFFILVKMVQKKLIMTEVKLIFSAFFSAHRNGEFFAPFSSSVGEDFTSTWRGHALQKSVNPLSFSLTWLICTFHKAKHLLHNFAS